MNDRQKILETLGRLGADISVLSACPTAALEEFVRILRGKEPDSDIAQFSEQQRSEFTRVQRYIEKNHREIERVTPGKSLEMLKTFADAIANGYKAIDLLPPKDA